MPALSIVISLVALIAGMANVLVVSWGTSSEASEHRKHIIGSMLIAPAAMSSNIRSNAPFVGGRCMSARTQDRGTL